MSGLESDVHKVMAAINRAWRENRPAEMEVYLHPDVTMVLPGFNGAVTGRETLLTSFDEFCSNARVLEYMESDEQIQIISNIAFVNFRFEMLYERAAYRERSTGRDVWVFKSQDGKWLAVWRLMVDLKEIREILQ
jgi:Domain of unknown function (DUF4440)